MSAPFNQVEWDRLIVAYPPGTPVTGVVRACDLYGAWIVLDQLPDVPALLEIIHFAIIESDPGHRIKYPEDYPATGTRVNARILGWCLKPKDVRLTQLRHLDWIHSDSGREE